MSYSDTLETDLDRARALLGDTSNDPTTELLTDDHIDAVLALYAYTGGVAFLARELAVRFAQTPDRVTLPSGLSVSWSERVKLWTALAVQMEGSDVGASGAFSVTPTRTDGYATAAAL